MTAGRHLFILVLDAQRYAFQLASISRVVRMVEVTPLPKAAAAILGVVNVEGEVIPVVDLRSCLNHPPRPVDPQDVLVIVEAGRGRMAIAADAVGGVIEKPEKAMVFDSNVQRQSELLEGVVKLADGMVMVCDVERIAALCGECATGPQPGAELEQLAAPDQDEAKRERAKTLRERAQKLAREPVKEEGDQRLEIVEFVLSGEQYAIESSFIREVYPLRDLTPLPCTPPFVLGIVNMRGKILSVIDMRKFFELPGKGLSDLNKVIILEHGAMEFGILADAIIGVRTIPARELQPSLPTLTEIRADYLRGVTKDRLVVLDAGRMLSDRRIVVHEEV